ncbi:MAG: type I restriction endonuclease subunit R [Spirochaetales bacterium]|nr:type I restriction endonuclease subunit R [Spirochaetales bacterium]
MSNAPKNATERAFQENFVNELKKYKWESPDSLNGNIKKVTVKDLINNWRSELNRINADQLEGVPLTDNEFKQVMSKVNQISNSFEAAKVLSMEGNKGKIDGIYRDDHPDITRKQITLTILKKAEVSGGDSSYTVAREVQTDKGNRFDIVLLINGLPLINIEQKRTDKSLDEAYGQFIRYYRDGEYSNNFMAFSQMMVITTEIETRYFATPKSVDDFNTVFVFHWADKYNEPVNEWKKVIENFLMIPMAHQMVGDYLVIDEARDEENRKHMLMRPYQVYALQSVEGAAFGFDNKERIPHGGFVWHTTGSGKTITSFKTALFLATRAGFDKVVFLVDRRELDSKTSEEFKAYAKYEPVDVDDTKFTYQLKKKLQSAKPGIIVTTTFKLNILVNELEEAKDNSLAEKKIVFIIDEAHRTTMGQMMGDIKKYFKQKGLFFGFTGTPLFDENNIKGKINEKSEVIDTTEKLFGPKLHEYTIDQAIADGNVLGFHVDYINTGEFKSHEDLRDQLFDKIKEEHPDLPDREIERKVQTFSLAEVERQSKKYDILVYQDETHIPRVVTSMLDNWDQQSMRREFNAILTVAYKKRVIAYYDEFIKQLAERDMKLNIAMTFSFGDENDPENIVPVDLVKRMFKDYAQYTGIEFVAGDKKHGESAYFEDIISRTKRGGSGRNAKNIDLVIVADQLLTGYDSKRLNTLYVDRSLELQGLIQAYSRTNRIFGEGKEFGTIVNFQYPEITRETVDIALKLYGSGGSSSKAIVDTYENSVRKLKVNIEEMIPTLPNPADWQALKYDKEGLEKFLSAFRDAANQLNFVEQYYEYKWNDSSFGIDEHTWLKYVGAYKNLVRAEGSEPDPLVIRSLVGRTKLAGTQVIDANHILQLIGSKVSNVNGVQFVDDETLRIIHEQIQELSDMGDDNKANMLREFVNTELVPGKLEYGIHFDDAFADWKQNKLKDEIENIAEKWGIYTNLLLKSINSFTVSEPKPIPYIDEITKSVDYEKARDKSAGNKLKHIMTMTTELPDKFMEIKLKYK